MDETKILSEIEKLKQKPQLNRRERRYLAKLENKLHPPSKSKVDLKGIATKILLVLVGLLLIGGFGRYISTRPNLPPIDIQGHVEQNPPSHILNTGMSEPVQKHMLEHADGQGLPGVIIQYNCNKPYVCEKDLVNKLKDIIKKYPENVYLAPSSYGGKIILTRMGEREILDKYDKEKIKKFIAGL